MHSDGKSFHRPWKATSKAADKLSCIGNKEKQERAEVLTVSVWNIWNLSTSYWQLWVKCEMWSCEISTRQADLHRFNRPWIAGWWRVLASSQAQRPSNARQHDENVKWKKWCSKWCFNMMNCIGKQPSGKMTKVLKGFYEVTWPFRGARLLGDQKSAFRAPVTV